MKICIVGAGAIGGLLAAAFTDAGHEVALVARGAHLRVLESKGLTLRSGDTTKTYRLAAAEDPAAFGAQDAVLITLKAYSIGSMLPRLRPILRQHTAVVTAINGLPWWYFYREGGRFDGSSIECLDPEGVLQEALDAKHLVGCVVHAAGEVVEPGVVLHTNGKLFVLGEIDGALTARTEALATAISRGGLEGRASTQIRNDIWMKLIGNMSYNPVAALTLARMNEINANDELLRLIRVQMQEAMAVAEAYGIHIGMSVDERIGIAKTIGSSKISMHQDIERGRPMETDAIIGAVLELARRASIETPMIDAINALIVERARH